MVFMLSVWRKAAYWTKENVPRMWCCYLYTQMYLCVFHKYIKIIHKKLCIYLCISSFFCIFALDLVFVL